MFIDDLKLFSKTKEQQDTLVKNIHVFSTDIEMEFGMKNCGILTMKRGKVVRSQGIKFRNNEEMKDFETEGYTYLGTVELDKIKDNEMKKNQKTIKEYKQSLQLVLKFKLNEKSKITAIKTWAVAVFRYRTGILK